MSEARFYEEPRSAKLTLSASGTGYFDFGDLPVNKVFVSSDSDTEVLVMASSAVTAPSAIPSAASSPVVVATSGITGELRTLTAGAAPQVFERHNAFRYWHVRSSADAVITAIGALHEAVRG